MTTTPVEQNLGVFLRDLPGDCDNKYSVEADCRLRERLFRSLANNDKATLGLLFPRGTPHSGEKWKLKEAQGAEDGAEYTAAAKGHACGHIFKTGESTYHCKTCAADDTCVLCARCFAESDHDGHMVYISVSSGNSGCCDCADDEAWVRPVHCSIHSADDTPTQRAAGKSSQKPVLPDDLLEVIHMTIGKALDYLCDVFSCSPEQLRLPKNEESIKADELLSRLTSDHYGGPEVSESDEEYALILWNDEKHTVNDVRDQVAKACRKSKSFGLEKAMEVNDIGRSILHYSKDVQELLRMASIIEQLKVTVTIRSARDTFREQMCGTIVDWISDISGCSYGSDPHVLRDTVCRELLRPWRMGSEATNAAIGKSGIDDHEYEDNVRERRAHQRWFRPLPGMNIIRVEVDGDDDQDDDDDEDDDDDLIVADDIDESEDGGGDESMDVDEQQIVMMLNAGTEMDIDLSDGDGPAENIEAVIDRYASPPPLPANPRERAESARIFTPGESDNDDSMPSQTASSAHPQAPFSNLPKTPKVRVKGLRPPKPAKYWLETPEEYNTRQAVPMEEDLWQRVRLDYLVLYDLRLWKTLRIELRHLYISTVVTIPQFKRVLGLRFAGLYTMLAQLYLIADREPDHSIINLSVQMLTTPSITADVVERGNFLTNLMAILYTFLTTRQVGFPQDVNPTATLAFDAGAVNNRRMFHFFMDTRYMFQSAFVAEKIRMTPRYLLQFLDLVKLHQGICPNIRAVTEHVEYEADAWISASMIIKEINKLCRQIAEAFRNPEDGDVATISRAIRDTARATYINSFGLERDRFKAAEIKGPQDFYDFPRKSRPQTSIEKGYEQMVDVGDYSIPRFRVASGAMSFHHPLHHLLSWLLEAGKGLTRSDMSSVLHFHGYEWGRDPWNSSFKPATRIIGESSYDETVCMLFEHPLRVCVWLAQMRAGMWVRNGVTLRHQMHTYRGTAQRDVSYQRDIVMLQAGLVLCAGPHESIGERFLAQMIDRFDMGFWIRGAYEILPAGYDDQQRLDVTEDFYHLLVILLSERGNLLPGGDKSDQHIKTAQRDIAHVLCFKPLSFSDISTRLTDRIADNEEFDGVLEKMTKFRSPEGLNDSGTFELNPEYIEMIDPYYAYYNRNQREEADNIYREYMAKKTGKAKDDIVYEPVLTPITSGLFTHLSAFTQTALFSKLIFWGIEFALRLAQTAESAHLTRTETLLHVVLHLTLLAVLEDSTPKGPKPVHAEDSFVRIAITSSFSEDSPKITILASLFRLLELEAFASCSPKIRLILERMSQKWPEEFIIAKFHLAPNSERANTASPASLSAEDKEAKKRQALERQARVMAQFKAQQTSFMDKQGLNWEDDTFSDEMDEDTEAPAEAEEKGPEYKTWSFPSGSCMLCQEETNDQRLYGTFAFMAPSRILRQTPINDVDYLQEVLDTPASLDRSAEAIRPFGVARKGKEVATRTTSDGTTVVQERQGLSKGFPEGEFREGPIVSSCGHIMHFSCFEAYVAATQRRHGHQIARNHPERPESKEFLCPLCKALGNAFLPMIWKDKQYSFPSSYGENAGSVGDWIASGHLRQMSDQANSQESAGNEYWRQAHMDQMQKALVPSLATAIQQLPRRSAPADEVEPDPTEEAPRRRSFLPEIFQRRAAEIGLPVLSRPARPAESTFAVPSEELILAYKRIEESLRPTGVLHAMLTQLEPGTQSSAVQQAEALCNALAFTISSVEIAQRGVASPVETGGETLLEAIPDQTMTTLRVLSETVSSVTAMTAIRASSQAGREATAHRSWQTQLLHLLGEKVNDHTKYTPRSLLESDLFVFFTKCTLNELQMGDSMHHILHLCYSAEIIKVLFAFFGRLSLNRAAMDNNGTITTRWQPPIMTTLPQFQRWIHDNDIKVPHAVYVRSGKHIPIDMPFGTKWFAIGLQPSTAAVLETLIDKYALTFLRKAMILLHVRFGMDFSADTASNPDAPELDRLTQLLRLPKPSEVMQELGAPSQSGESFRNLAAQWLRMATPTTNQPAPPNTLARDAQSLSHPAIFELVGLPKNYDTLTEETIKRRCPTTGKEVTDPALCLFCGEIFCSQAGCCMKDRNKGGCYQHRERCGGNIGIFISIRKCMVLFLHNGHGSWYHAPYLDRHGEVDPTLRRHHQLFLNQKRYDKLLRDAWLGHGIPSVISRRLEGDMNTGGWETL